MQTEQIKLTQVSTNERNPRKITDANIKKLINSILVFPRMLELRPIVIDDAMVPLGGNMRIKALNHIASMSISEIKQQLQSVYDFNKKTKKQQYEIESYWEEWEKTIHVVRAKNLSEEEKQQFIIKDNVSFGEWNFDNLKNWDSDALNDWGLDIDLTETSISTPVQTDEQEQNTTAETIIPQEALPEELQGLDIVPQDLPKLQGDGETKNEYISISYTDDQADILAEIIGIKPDKLYSKIVYNINELLNLKNN